MVQNLVQKFQILTGVYDSKKVPFSRGLRPKLITRAYKVLNDLAPVHVSLTPVLLCAQIPRIGKVDILLFLH